RQTSSPPATERRVWESAFTALAVVVPHYRTIALFAADGETEVFGADPAEPEAAVATLLTESRRLARVVSASGVKQLGKPAIHYADRSFLLYATPLASGGSVVIASDVAMFLAAASWPRVPLTHLYITDAARTIWSECDKPSGCRPTVA